VALLRNLLPSLGLGSSIFLVPFHLLHASHYPVAPLPTRRPWSELSTFFPLSLEWRYFANDCVGGLCDYFLVNCDGLSMTGVGFMVSCARLLLESSSLTFPLPYVDILFTIVVPPRLAQAAKHLTF